MVSYTKPVSASFINGRLRPPRLYKYRSFPTLEGLTGCQREAALQQRRYVIQTLETGKVRFSKASDFNDSLEFRPRVPPIAAGDVEGLERAARDLRRNFDNALARNQVSREAYDKLMSDESKVRRLASYRHGPIAAITEFFRTDAHVYCLSDVLDEQLMWAHYADCHRGIAIHFNALRPPFSWTGQVQYSAAYPTLIEIDIFGPAFEDFVSTAMYTKNVKWSYEQEWRLSLSARQMEEHKDELEATFENDIMTFDVRRIVGVTLGARIAPDSEEAIRSIAEKMNLQLSRAVNKNGYFGMDIVDAN